MAFLLRLSPELHARAVASAADLGLSMNRFITLAVEEHFRRCGDRPVLSVDAAAVPAAAVDLAPAAAPAAAKAAPAVSPRRSKRRKRR